MYTVIRALPEEAVYQLPDRQSTNQEREVYRLMQMGELTELKVFRLIAMHYDAIPFIVQNIPMRRFMQLFQEHGLLESYLSAELFDQLCDINRARLHIEILNGEGYSSLLDTTVPLNNCLNGRYNFLDKVWQKRYKRFLEEMGNLSTVLQDCVAGADVVLHFATRVSERSVLTFYPIVEKVVFPDGPVETVIDGNYVLLQAGSFTIRLFTKRLSPGQVMLMTSAAYFPETRDLVCLPEFYKGLSDDNSLQAAVELPDWHPELTHGFNIRQDFKNLRNIDVKRCYNSNCRRFYCFEQTVQEYRDMCYDCGLLNYDKRHDSIDMTGVKAYVSGCRIKIGYATVLKLLRCGAEVIGSTRFPGLARYNYSAEPDYKNWCDRLTILQCDFTNLSDVTQLIEYLKKEQIDVFINNACQTVKPTQFYLDHCHSLERQVQMLEGRRAIANGTENCEDQQAIVTFMEQHDITLNQFKDVYDPTMMKDSSWFKKIEEVEVEEILHVNVINQVVPTMLVNQVMPTMNPDSKTVIMVTAVEGQFDSSKRDGHHTHTNMCKAGINMMVYTMGTAPDKSLHIYSVDPGFVSGVNPFNKHYPLLPEDGAARILDPVFNVHRETPLKSGIKLKDYQESPW